MTGAMYAAVSGLKAHMSALNVIGNNISNVNTLAYKATRYTFNESLYTSSRSGSNGTTQVGGRNPAQIGYGCSIGTIDLDMSTKNYTPTGKALDTMIDGDGFFILGDKSDGILTQAQLQGMNLSRLGNFSFDSQGYLVDGNGSVVYGFLRYMTADEWFNANCIGADGEVVTAPDGVYYASADDVPESKLTSPVLTAIRYPQCIVYTNDVGTTSTLLLWPTVGDDGAVHDFQMPDDGNLGAALEAAGIPVPSDWPGYTEDMDWTAAITGEDGETVSLEVSRLQPDTVSIDEKSGAISFVTKDGIQGVLGYLALAKVDNPDGVTHVDGRYYQALGGAGNVHLTSVGGAISYVRGNADWTYGSEIDVESSGGTNLVTGGLESSGTDLANEISNMIVIQRGYQANTRIVSVTDSMLEELVNMKR